MNDKHDKKSKGKDHSSHEGHEQIFRRKFWVCLILTVPVIIFSATIQEWLNFSLPNFPGSFWITPFFSVVIFFYGGLPFLSMAKGELKKKKPGMMTLISLAIVVAFIYSIATLFMKEAMGFFWELVTLIDVMLLGHWIEMRSVRKASGALDELAKLMPDNAERVKDDGSTEEVKVTELEEDDLILVRPGASVPADGEIEEGKSSLNESMITGESKPVDKESGEKVIAGTINGDGSLRVRVKATGDDTALAGIMRLVKEARESKSDTQMLADKAAGWLFYVALGTALVTTVVWTLIGGFDVNVIKRTATVLVIACPHALGLAIPLVVAITTSIAAGIGILVRDRIALERARDIDVVMFDKTGTLTKGEWGVAGIEVKEGWEEDKALALAAAIEGDSEHMVAQGIRKASQERELSPPEVEDFEAIKGRGVKARYEGKQVYMGGPNLLEELEASVPKNIEEFAEEAGSKGQSVVYLLDENEPVGAFAMADVVRPESKEVIQRLHDMGIEVAMITGDSEEVAKAVAEQLSIDTYFAEVVPENKDKKVSELQENGKTVAMVGDGINDAPALTRADVGIAIGSGTDVAIESAGIILVKNNPGDVVEAIQLSHANHRKMVQNLWWATGYNVIALPLAAGVLVPVGISISPAVGAIIMSASTVIVAINAQLLKRQYSDKGENKND